MTTSEDAYLTLIPEPAEDWQQRAACRGMKPDLFYLERGRSGDARAAKALCRICLAKPDCLATAIRNDEHFGIWGGLSPRARTNLVRQLKTRAA